ncbi:MAG: tRNA (guanosine(37)-N1)-methyltransferase TrmD [Bacteroidales bacterium]|jgi:tRNA (guanine37-N1)-methyltransferase|nr:tRNA (guanosine(37)-N1)-methyltransferase TrmD [Bacteroidales bacterium]
MRIDIISGVPELLESPLDHSIIKRGKEKGNIEIHVHNLRDYTTNKHNKIDDYSFGGDAGMVLTIQPIDSIISKLTSERKYDEIIYTSPDGIQYTQKEANKLATFENIIILCGHYKGVDQRVRDNYITMEISIGDYVLTGGELAAAIITDSVVRLIPGVISDETSALTDSFQDNLLAPPVYTRPSNYKGLIVPEVLLSGNFKKIDEWKEKQSIERTNRLRPNLLNDE